MAKYTIHDVDPDVWSHAEAKAQAEGWNMGALLKQLLADYGSGRVTPSSGPQRSKPGQGPDLTLRATMHAGSGPEHQIDRRAIKYEVGGLPPGQSASIAHFPGMGWRVIRDGDDLSEPDRGWHGAYSTPEAALGYLRIRLALDEP